MNIKLLVLLLLLPGIAHSQATTRPPQVTWTGPIIFDDGSPLDFLLDITKLEFQCSNDDFVSIVLDEQWDNDSLIVTTGVADQYMRNADGGLPNSSTHVCRHRVAIDDPLTGLLWGDYSFTVPFKIRGKPGKTVVDLVQ